MKHMIVEISDGVPTMTLARPEQLNALISRAAHDLHKAVERLRDAEVLVLIGTGRAVCAGREATSVPWRGAPIHRATSSG